MREERAMAPRPYWKGYLRLSLVQCPIALYPATTERHYENALRELIRRKRKGEKTEPEKPARPSNVVNLMDALRRSVETGGGGSRRGAPERRRPARRAGGRARKAG